MSYYDFDLDESYETGDDYDEPDDEDKWECAFPGQCIMPYPHMRSECHTAEMAAEYALSMEAESCPKTQALIACNELFRGLRADFDEVAALVKAAL